MKVFFILFHDIMCVPKVQRATVENCLCIRNFKDSSTSEFTSSLINAINLSHVVCVHTIAHQFKDGSQVEDVGVPSIATIKTAS